MTDRWNLTAMISLPVIALTAYLLWLWPRPHGVSLWAELGPYLLSLLTGLPFAWRLRRGVGRAWVLVAFFGGGLVLLWIFAALVLCGVRGVCL